MPCLFDGPVARPWHSTRLVKWVMPAHSAGSAHMPDWRRVQNPTKNSFFSKFSEYGGLKAICQYVTRNQIIISEFKKSDHIIRIQLQLIK
jgi:hypothetical protein